MNQLRRSGSFTKSASAFVSTNSPSPTYQGYARFMKVSAPVSVPSQERDQRMLQFKESLDKQLASTIDFQEAVQNKRKQDHASFDDFVKSSRLEKADLQEQYDQLFSAHTTLQTKYLNLNNENKDFQVNIDTGVHLNTSLQTLLDIKNQEIADKTHEIAHKNQEIDDLNETLKLYIPQSPNLNTLVTIMNAPEHETEMQRG